MLFLYQSAESAILLQHSGGLSDEAVDGASPSDVKVLTHAQTIKGPTGRGHEMHNMYSNLRGGYKIR